MTVRIAIIVSVVVLAGGDAWAQESPRVQSPDQLLDVIRQRARVQQDEDARREAEFRAKKADQARLLADARAAQTVEEERSTALEAMFDANEAVIRELQDTLRERLGTLGELFGVVRQVAGDTLGFIRESLVSAQFPGREAFLKKITGSRHLPSADDLERLWITLQEEMTESGRVARFRARVVGTEGDEREREVVRLGPFNVISEGRYLQYLPETRQLAELPRQPPARHLASVSEFATATEGLVGVSIDPSRGSLLALLIQTPGVGERVQQGGRVGYVILVLGVVGLAIAGQRLVSLTGVARKMRAQIGNDVGSEDNPLGRVLQVHERNQDADVETLELKLDEAILREAPALERGTTLVRVLSVIAPLLGLLGTVTGMIRTFQAITLFGTGDPKLMAGGISEALVTTMLGLIVAIPLLLLHSVVSSRSRALVQILEEESAGIVAAHAERRRETG
jgi:biopolymer transport protein ExbB